MTTHRSAIAVALLSVSVALSTGTAQAPVFPSESWRTGRPKDAGLSQAVLDSIDREIKAGQYGYVNAHDATGPYNDYSPWWHPYYRGGDLHTLQISHEDDHVGDHRHGRHAWRVSVARHPGAVALRHHAGEEHR